MPCSSHGLHHNETQLDISYSITRSEYRNGSKLLSQVERGRGEEEGDGGCMGLQNKLLPDITCLFCSLVHALRTWEEHLFGVADRTYREAVGKTKGRIKAIALFKSL